MKRGRLGTEQRLLDAVGGLLHLRPGVAHRHPEAGGPDHRQIVAVVPGHENVLRATEQRTCQQLKGEIPCFECFDRAIGVVIANGNLERAIAGFSKARGFAREINHQVIPGTLRPAPCRVA